MRGGGGSEGETGDSQGSRKTFESAAGSPLTQTIVCVFYLAAKIETLEATEKIASSAAAKRQVKMCIH